MRAGYLYSLILLTGLTLPRGTVVAETSTGELHRQPARSASAVDMLPGIVEPRQQVTLGAPVDGVLMTVHVREGETVKQGDLLALMDNRVAQAAVQLAQAVAARTAAIRRAESQLEIARHYLQRVTQAAEAASELEKDNAEGNVRLARVALQDAHEQARTAKMQLQLDRARLARHELRAPFDGRILNILARPGQSVNQAEPVLTLANLDTLCVELNVPVAWYGKLVPNHAYDLMAAGPVEAVVPSQLICAYPVIDAGTQTFRCLFQIHNTDHRWPAGFAVTLLRPLADQRLTAEPLAKRTAVSAPISFRATDSHRVGPRDVR